MFAEFFDISTNPGSPLTGTKGFPGDKCPDFEAMRALRCVASFHLERFLYSGSGVLWFGTRVCKAGEGRDVGAPFGFSFPNAPARAHMQTKTKKKQKEICLRH